MQVGFNACDRSHKTAGHDERGTPRSMVSFEQLRCSVSTDVPGHGSLPYRRALRPEQPVGLRAAVGGALGSSAASSSLIKNLKGGIQK